MIKATQNQENFSPDTWSEKDSNAISDEHCNSSCESDCDIHCMVNHD